jgi:hypothetical protein
MLKEIAARNKTGPVEIYDLIRSIGKNSRLTLLQKNMIGHRPGIEVMHESDFDRAEGDWN